VGGTVGRDGAGGLSLVSGLNFSLLSRSTWMLTLIKSINHGLIIIKLLIGRRLIYEKKLVNLISI
jgi:hypothetical protein